MALTRGFVAVVIERAFGHGCVCVLRIDIASTASCAAAAAAAVVWRRGRKQLVVKALVSHSWRSRLSSAAKYSSRCGITYGGPPCWVHGAQVSSEIGAFQHNLSERSRRKLSRDAGPVLSMVHAGFLRAFSFLRRSKRRWLLASFVVSLLQRQCLRLVFSHARFNSNNLGSA